MNERPAEFRRGAARGEVSSLADQWAEKLIPQEVDWSGWVREYPKTSLVVAATGGFIIGKLHGPEIWSAVTSAVARRLHSAVDHYAEYARRDAR